MAAPAIPPLIIRGVPRLDPLWFERFGQIATSDIADQVGRLYTMEGIWPLYAPMNNAVGQALTVKPWPGDGLAVHGAVAMAQDGDILVVDARGYLGVTGCGYSMLRNPHARGLRGFVIDGALRDIEEMRKAGFPAFGRGLSTHSSIKQHPGEINVPIACGGVIVSPGDLVVADGEGVVVVPVRYLESTWAAVSAARTSPPTPESVQLADEKRTGNFERMFESAGGETIEWLR